MSNGQGLGSRFRVQCLQLGISFGLQLTSCKQKAANWLPALKP